MRWLALAFLPFAAHAEPWQGIWAADLDWCAQADRIGRVTPAPIALTETEFLGYENSCTHTRVEKLARNFWQISMTCQAEGSRYEQTIGIVTSTDAMSMSTDGQAPVYFKRCPET